MIATVERIERSQDLVQAVTGVRGTDHVVVRLQRVAPAQSIDRLCAFVDVSAEDRVILVQVEVEKAGVDRRFLVQNLRKENGATGVRGAH